MSDPFDCQKAKEEDKIAASLVQNLTEEDLGVYVWCKGMPDEYLVELVYQGMLQRNVAFPHKLFYCEIDWVAIAANPGVVLELQRIRSL